MLNLSTESKKEIELRVAQELQNNKNFIYDTRQSFNKMTESIDHLHKTFEDHVAGVGKGMVAQDIIVDELERKFNTDMMTLRNCVEENRQRVLEGLRKMEAFIKHAEENFVSSKFYMQTVSPLGFHIAQYDQELKRLRDLIADNHCHMQKHVHECIDSCKKEIAEVPTGIPEIKTFVDEQMNLFKHEFKCVRDEMNVLKKDLFIKQKHIEHLMTELKKLKEG